jgi:hypothetical protein
LGLAIGKLTGGSTARSSWRWYVFCAVAANVPDLDFLPGFFTGDVNRFHQSASHSLVAALIFGAAAALAGRYFHRNPVRIGLAGVGLYSSHLLLDLFIEDKRAPFGIPLLWPFVSEHFAAPWPIFHGVRHGVPGEDLLTFVGHVFSSTNVGVVAFEMLILAPLLLLSWYMTRGPMLGKHKKNRCRTFNVAEHKLRKPNAF